MDANSRVLSLRAGRSYAVVMKHCLYSCPVTYQYRPASLVSFRKAPPEHSMERVFRVEAVFELDPFSSPETWNVSPSAKQRIESYIAEAKRIGVLSVRGLYRFLLLNPEHVIQLSPPKKLPGPEPAPVYVALAELQSNNPFVEPIRALTYAEKLRDPRWHEKREALFKTRGKKCELCASTERITVHHGYYGINTDPWDHEDCTLWVLCWPCHEQTQRVLVKTHFAIGCVHPKDLPTLQNDVVDAASLIRHGITDSDINALLEEEQLIEATLFGEYSADIFSNSDLGPSIADEIATAATQSFPGIEVTVILTEQSPDGTASVVGPDPATTQKITHFLERERGNRG